MGKQEFPVTEEVKIYLDRCERVILRFVMSKVLKKTVTQVFKELKTSPYKCLVGSFSSYLDMVSKKQINPVDFFKGILVGVAIAYNSGQDKNLEEMEALLFKSKYYN